MELIVAGLTPSITGQRETVGMVLFSEESRCDGCRLGTESRDFKLNAIGAGNGEASNCKNGNVS